MGLLRIRLLIEVYTIGFCMLLFFNKLVGEETAVVELEPFYVHAYRFEEDIERYPGNITVIDQADIESSGLSNVAEVLENRAGIHFRSFSGNSSSSEIDLRGYGEGSGMRTLILIDGQKLNRPDMGVPSWLEIPIGQVERIEVIRGSQSARYGNHAVGGVINIITKLGKYAGPANHLRAVYGSFDTRMLKFSHLGSLSNWNYAIHAEDSSTSGYRENGGHDVTSGTFNLGSDLSSRISMRLGFSYLEERVEFPGPLSEERYRTNPRQSIYPPGDPYFSLNEKLNANATVQIEMTETINLNFQAGFSHRDQKWNFGPGSHTDNVLQSYSIEPQFSWQPNEDLNIAAGFSHYYDTLDVTLFEDFDRTIVRLDDFGNPEESDLARESYSLFTYGDWAFYGPFSLSSALRWERTSLTFERLETEKKKENGYAAQVGINSDFNESWRSWVRYDLLYRFPVTDEIAAYQGFPLGENGDTPFNQELEAETGHNVELGIEHKTASYRLLANAFAQWLNDEIAYDFVRNLNVNLADTRRVGVELSGQYYAEDWEFRAFYTWLTSRYLSGPNEGKEVYLVPEHRFTATASYQLSEKLKLQSEYLFVAESFEGNDLANDQPPLPSYSVFNFLIQFKPNDSLEIFARINNALDKQYATLKYNGSWYPAPERHIRTGISITF